MLVCKNKRYARKKNVLYSISLWKSYTKDNTFKLTNFPSNHSVSSLFPQLRSLDNIND